MDVNWLAVLGLAVICWAVAALVGWAIVHVGARDDPEDWDR